MDVRVVTTSNLPLDFIVVVIPKLILIVIVICVVVWLALAYLGVVFRKRHIC